MTILVDTATLYRWGGGQIGENFWRASIEHYLKCKKTSRNHGYGNHRKCRICAWLEEYLATQGFDWVRIAEESAAP